MEKMVLVEDGEGGCKRCRLGRSDQRIRRSTRRIDQAG